MKPKIRWITLALLITVLLLSACARGPASAPKVEPATLEKVEGSDFGRVILTEKAAERIGLETTMVGEEEVARRQIVGGEIVSPDSLATIPITGGIGGGSANAILVHVSLNPSELERVDRSQPARVLPLDDDDAEGLTAEAFELNEEEDADEPGDIDTGLYYSVNSAELTPGQRVRVELALSSAEAQRLVIPYAAVIYGLEGETWVYTSPEPLVFVRHPITVEFIEGDLAYLSEGPPPGTAIVTVGVAELLGVELGVGK